MASAQQRAFTARTTHTHLSERDKLALGVPLNIYDAARSYRRESGQIDTGLRALLKEARFRNAWRTFRGGGIKGNRKTTFQEKMRAAEIMGWAPPRNKAISRLRNISP